VPAGYRPPFPRIAGVTPVVAQDEVLVQSEPQGSEVVVDAIAVRDVRLGKRLAVD
jgi:hypothetical protein